MIYKGTITDFQGSWQSGVASLWVNGHPVLCENAPTVRSLGAAFPGFIKPGHVVDVDHIKGERIVFALDDMIGMLDGFGREDDADFESNPDVEVAEYMEENTPWPVRAA